MNDHVLLDGTNQSGIPERFNHGTFNIVVDGQWGSCGKGLINTALADRFRPQVISTTNMANAGHTCVIGGETFVAKILPTSALLMKHRNGYAPLVVIGPSAGFSIDRLREEVEQTQCHHRLVIHPRAGIILERHKQAESCNTEQSTKHIASTMQGCGAMLAEKILRRPDFPTAGAILEDFGSTWLERAVRFEAIKRQYDTDSLGVILNRLLDVGATILHEGSQGFSLGINHGSHYPYCTSRECTAAQMVADMGVSPFRVGEIFLVIRPYPIRVGNVVEDGVQLGYSGDGYPGQREMTWEEVARLAGAPQEVMKGELTTVTKRLRRVFTFSDEQLRQAVTINGATQIALNFANYIDWQCFGCNNFSALPNKVIDFIARIEEVARIPVTIVGTGPKHEDVCFRF